ncbi:MAG TPA: HepT-like ribonuclease domain-containing protein [Thermoanaerobaculia bacterium]|nr:HepT-like ribonuclease domain-containing protein [Thermoanaerobaculia bacterium]
MRDKLIHDYIRVDLEVVWETVTRNLPDIVPQIRRLLSDVDSGSDL